MVCKICGKDIPKGQRYKGENYASIPFCSKECYDVKNNEISERRKLTDYIQSIYPDPDNIPWGQIGRQIQRFQSEFSLNDSQTLFIIKYAVELEKLVVNPEYGFGQFSNYVEPAIKFLEKYRESQRKAETFNPEPSVYYVKPQSKKRIFRER